MFHKKTIRELIHDHKVNYSTVRHVLAQYYLFGRTEARRFQHKTKQNKGHCSSGQKKTERKLTSQNEKFDHFATSNVKTISTNGSKVTLHFNQMEPKDNLSEEKD